MSRSEQLPFADPLPPLAAAERNELLYEAYQSYEQLFTAVRIARGKSSNSTALGGVSGKTTRAVMMCTTTTIAGTLEEVAEIYTARDSHFMLDFAHSSRLYELESPTPAHPMRCIGLRWSRWASISKLVSDRDLLYLETMDDFVDKKTGRRGWARCTKSIEHRACPPSQHPNGAIRAELFVMGMVVRETPMVGVLELITLVHADVKNSIPTWITRTVLKSRKKNALRLNHVLKVRRRVREGGSNGSGSGSNGGGSSYIGDFTGAYGLSSDDASRAMIMTMDHHTVAHPRDCKGCMDRVSRWSRTYKCRKCKELICKNCAVMSYYDTDTHAMQNRICAECSFGGDGGDQDETSSSSGDAETKNKHSNGSQRQRAFSYLSVDNESVTSVETTNGIDELGSTMYKLTLLNASQLNTVKAEPHYSESHAPHQAHNHSQIHGLRRQHSTSSTTSSTSSSTAHRGSKHSQRRGKMERAGSQDAASFHCLQAPTNADWNGAGAAQGPAPSPALTLAEENRKVARRVRSSPAFHAATPPAPPPSTAVAVDLSYLQSFAQARPRTSERPASRPIGQLV